MEINLLFRLYHDILGYNTICIKRNNDNVKSYLINPKNPNSIVYIINSKTSNISSIKDKEHLDKELLKIVKENPNLNIDIQNIRKYYIFDCDRKEDNNGIIESLLKKYNNSIEVADDYTYGGMLLLSYPSIESFLIENFNVNSFEVKDKLINEGKIKEYLNENKILPNKMSFETVNNAISELINALKNIGIDKVNLDDISKQNLKIYDFEKERKNRYILSLLLVSLIDLGIIEFI